MLVLRLHSATFALLLALAAVFSASCQELTYVKDVVALKPMEASRNPRSVKLRGVVTEVAPTRTSFTLQEGGDAVGVKLAPGAGCPAMGDEIECEGTTYAHVLANYMHSHVLARSVRVIGPGRMPEPLPLSLPDLNKFRHFEQWVSVEGYVLKWKYNQPAGELTFAITNDNMWTTVILRSKVRPGVLSSFMGARVRATGINSGIRTHDMNGAMIVPSLDYLEVLKPGRASTFDAPVVSMRDVARGLFKPGERVKVRGVVVAVWNFRLCLRGENGGALINTMHNPWNREAESVEEYGDAGPPPVLKEGLEVELVGSPPVSTGYGLSYGDVRIIGPGKAADPEKVAIETLKSRGNKDDWVSIEGAVSAWSLQNNTMTYSVHGPRDRLIVTIPDVTLSPFPNDLHGARVRFTGIAIAWSGGTNFFVPNLSYAEVIKPGRASPFDAPAQSVADVAARRVPPGEPMKLKGVVIGRPSPSTLHVRGRDAALRVRLRSPLPRQSGNTVRYTSDGAPVPGVKIGDELEIAGWPAGSADDAAFDVIDADVRVVASLGPVQAVVTTLAKVAAGDHASDRVELRARLLSINEVSTSTTEWRSTLLLESGGVRLPAVHQGKASGALGPLRIDDEILVQGLVDREDGDGRRHIRIISPTDIRTLGVSPAVLKHRAWLWGGGGLGVVLLLGGWIVVLRRANRSQAQSASELKAARDAALESEQRWKLLFEQSPLSVQIFSPDGQTMRFNEAWKCLFRLSDEQGYAFNVLKDPDLNASGAVNLIRRAFEGEVVHVPPVPFPVKSDPPEHRWIGGVLYPVKNGEGQITEVVTIHNDITEMKRAEEAMLAINQTLENRVQERTSALEQAQSDLQRALEQERELGELKSRFVSMVSHEFRTPLGIIMSAVELLQHYSDRLPEEEKQRQLHEIQSGTKHMGDLMEQVLLLGRAEAGKLACKPQSLDLVALAERIIDEMLSISNRKCPITLQTEGDLASALADEALLRHIFGNLVVNAVKYSPEGSEVVFSIRREDKEAVFEIIDRGIGIPEKDRARLFEAFYRCSNVGDTPGTGLGLVIVKRCVDLHGGSIDIDSLTGAGTTFTIRLSVFS